MQIKLRLLINGLEDRELIPDYLGGPDIFTRVLNVEDGGRRGVQCDAM